MSASASGAPVRALASMPNERSKPIGLQALGLELAAEVAGAAGQVGDERARAEAQVADRALAPSDVHAERHDPVHQVVAGGDGVEHGPHGADLLVALGEGRGVV